MIERPRATTLAVLTMVALPATSRPADDPKPSPPPGLVVPVRTELVLADAVVTDKDGRYVTALQASDFEISEDGQRRAITHFRYMTTEAPTVAALAHAAEGQPSDHSGISRAAAPERQATKRTMAIIVDDLSLTFESRFRTRRMLANLVDQRLAAGDLLAIVRTGGGIGNLQQFTTDKRLLKAAVDGIPFNLAGRGMAGGETLRGDTGPQGGSDSRGDAPPASTSSNPAQAAIEAAERSLREMTARFDRERRANLTVGMLGAVESVMRGLQRMPGRKSVLLVSEGFSLEGGREHDTRMRERLLELIDAANKASVVVYALNPSGLQTIGLSASDLVAPGTADLHEGAFQARASFRELRVGLTRLAEETGGFTLFDSNDLDHSVLRVFEDQKGYYLLGYDPGPLPPGRQERGRFHRISVKVTRPGLRVRSRRGFYSRSEAPDAEPAPVTFADTLLSPFAAVDVPVRLTALFNYHPKRGAFLRCLIHIDARGMTIHEEADGSRRLDVEAGVQSISANGKLTERAGGSYTLRLQARAAEAALRGGFVLTLDVPVKPGPYQVRAGVRDATSGRAGSASQFVDVPDVAKGRLALSGIYMSGSEEGLSDAAAADSNPSPSLDPESTPAVRRFRGGMPVRYAFGVYNPAIDPATGRPHLAVVLNVYRDGTRVQTVPVPLQDVAPSAPGVVALGGRLHLSRSMEPGTYTLEIVLRDELRGAKDGATVQWIDFDLVGEPAGSS